MSFNILNDERTGLRPNFDSVTIPTILSSSGLGTDSTGKIINVGGSGGSFTLAAVDSAGAPNANGATLASNVFNLNSASATEPGVINTGVQTIAGNKTLTGNTQVSGTLGVTLATHLSNTLLVDGQTTEGTGILLPTTGATASNLNFYTVGSDALVLGGALSGVDYVLNWCRIGNIVTLTFPVITATTTSSATISSGVLPAYLRPVTSAAQVPTFTIIVTDPSTATGLGVAAYDGTSQFIFSVAPDGGFFTSGVPVSIVAPSLTYVSA